MTDKPEPLGEEEMARLRRHAEYLKTLPSSSVENSAFGLELIGLLATIDDKDARIRELEKELALVKPPHKELIGKLAAKDARIRELEEAVREFEEIDFDCSGVEAQMKDFASNYTGKLDRYHAALQSIADGCAAPRTVARVAIRHDSDAAD